MPKRTAFTLIELLVVVSIITALIAILLPALNKARTTAKAAHCGANLHQLGIGALAYTFEHKGLLPSNYGGGAHPFVTYWMLRTDMPTKHEPANLGHLLKYAKTPEFYYCVSLDPARDSLTYDGPDNPWNDGEGDSIARLRSSYPARSLQFTHGTGLNRWRLNEYAGKVLYSDFVGVDNWNGGGIIQGRINNPHEDTGYNRLFADGSVRWLSSGPVYDYRPVTTVTPTASEQHEYYANVLDIE